MKSNKRPFPTSILILLSVAILLGSSLQAHAVSKRMEGPLFWINKVKDPNRVLLTPSEIQKMNEKNLKRQDLLLCRVKDMKEEWTREEILTFLKEDWEGFGKADRVRYGKQGIPLDDSFWNALKESIHQDALKEKNRLLFGLTIKRADVRVFPTEELSMNTPTNYDFDLFQHSTIAPGSLVGIHHFSRDNLWAYVQTPFIRGWIRTIDLAIAKSKNDAFSQGEIKEPLVITGNFVRIFADPLFRQPVFSAQMGSAFRILRFPDQAKPYKPHYTISIPFKDADGRLTLGNGYIPANEDVHYGFLPYTQKNLAQQAFKMLHQPYGWGEMSGGRDCSRFIMDLFNTFGILMPRNSNLQARMGIPLGVLEGKTIEEKKKILDRAVPLATLLRMPGHIILYLGKHEGKHYAIHSIWGIQKEGKSGPVYQKIGKVAVTDLNLGKGGPNGSLLHRLTEIRLIGPDSEVTR
ncbi:MAG: SH3 domain-containing protein [Thermodesulfobacteriota bacterium]|nr:SH3 domain-containing protein [Thermodesulfobacteriota bacterium]